MAKRANKGYMKKLGIDSPKAFREDILDKDVSDKELRKSHSFSSEENTKQAVDRSHSFNHSFTSKSKPLSSYHFSNRREERVTSFKRVGSSYNMRNLATIPDAGLMEDEVLPDLATLKGPINLRKAQKKKLQERKPEKPDNLLDIHAGEEA